MLLRNGWSQDCILCIDQVLYSMLLGTNITDAENSRRELEKFIGPYSKMLQSVLANKTLPHSNT